MAKRQVYSLKALERELGISVRTLRRYIGEGKLQARKIGRTYYVNESSFRNFIGED